MKERIPNYSPATNPHRLHRALNALEQVYLAWKKGRSHPDCEACQFAQEARDKQTQVMLLIGEMEGWWPQ